MKKRIKWSAIPFAMIFVLLVSNVISPCIVNAEADVSDSVSVIYESNGADSGSVPEDKNTYIEGDTVQVLDNIGGLTRNGFQFGGWMTENIIFQPGDTFIIGNGDIVLKAVWIPVYRVYYDPNGMHSGYPPTDPVEYPKGAHVIVKGNTGGLDKPGYYGLQSWNTKPDGSGTTYYPGSTLVIENSDITLYAQYSTFPPLVNLTVYEVTYYANGATDGYTPERVSQYSPVTISGNPGGLRKDGYAFAGWNTKPDGTGELYKPGDKHDTLGHLSLYAHWTPVFTISYMADTNASVPSISNQHASGTNVKLLEYHEVINGPAPATFKGWNTESDGSGETYMPGDVISLDSDLTLYPIFETNPGGYIVTFDGNGNTDGFLPQKRVIAAGEEIYLPEQGTLAKEEHAFTGWFDNDGREYAAGEAVRINKNTTFYARWIKIFRVTYDKRGAIGVTAPEDNTVYLEGMPVTVKPFKVTSFKNWNTKPDGSGISYNPGDVFYITADTTLYATYYDLIVIDPEVPLIFILPFNYNGNLAEGGGPPEHGFYSPGSIVEIKGNTGNFYREGYVFDCWNTRPDGSGLTFRPGDTLTMPSHEVTLFAMWKTPDPSVIISIRVTETVKKYVVSYPILNSSQKVQKGDVIHVKDFSGLYKKGYTFGGWKDRNSGKVYEPGTPVTITRAYTFDPVWLPVVTHYRINYVPGDSYSGASGLPVDNTLYESGDVATVSSEIPTYPGQEFLCWSTSFYGYGNIYYPGDKIRFGMQDITLYAQFTVSNISFTYNGNGATEGESPASRRYKTGQKITVQNQNTLKKNGYYFDGWSTIPDASSGDYQAGDIITAGVEDIVLYAVWKEFPPEITPETYPITYKSYGHTGGEVPVDNNRYLSGTAVTLKNGGSLQKDGYILYGWLIDNMVYLPGDNFIMKNREVTAIAIWVPADRDNDVFITISFNGNGSTGGTVPESISCPAGQGAVLPHNTGNLTRPGYVFGGWTDNVKLYLPGQTYYMENSVQNTTLYAVWVPARTFSYNGNLNTGGSVPVDPVPYGIGETVTILDNVNNLTRDNHLFAGWFVRDRIYQPGETFTMGAENTVASAVWVALNDIPETPVPNTMPNRKAEVPGITTADAIKGDIFSLDLSEIFEDNDGDSLLYYVSVNGGPYEATSALYDYALTGTGTITLIFRASDGKSESTDTYTVIITVQKGSGDSSGGSSGGGSNPSGGSYPVNFCCGYYF